MAASWLLQCIAQDSQLLWNGLPERDPKFLPELFNLLFRTRKVPASPRLLLWVADPKGEKLRIVDSHQWGVVEDDKIVRQHLPTPPAAWTIDQPEPLRPPGL
jgi:hypothetical protein